MTAEVMQYTPLVKSTSPSVKKKRNLPGTPDPEAEVVALSPKTLTATNRYVCEVCGKGFQRDQNLQLHRRGHNLPWKLKLRTTKEPMKRVYVCPEKSCVHHNPTRALGDLTGIKKHFCRKHGEKKWKCDKCGKRYAVRSDWRAHSKICGTREYKCGCGTIFARRDSFVTHRAFCDALAEETARVQAAANYNYCNNYNYSNNYYNPFMGTNQLPPYSSTMTRQHHSITSSFFQPEPQQYSPSLMLESMMPCPTSYRIPFVPANPNLSATALLQKAAFVGSTTTADVDATELCGFYATEVVVSDVEDCVDDTCTNNMNTFYRSSGIFPGAKQQRIAPSKDDSVTDGAGGRTLDFLGVGGVPFICQPLSINGLY